MEADKESGPKEGLDVGRNSTKNMKEKEEEGNTKHV